MTMEAITLSRVLKQHKVSHTKTRQAVFDLLTKSEPLTMRELAEKLPSVNRSSVYRTIDLFEQTGIVHRLPIGWKYKIELTNSYQPHHHHITCLSCNMSTPFQEDDYLEELLASIAKNEDFVLQNHQIELQGLCANCRHKS